MLECPGNEDPHGRRRAQRHVGVLCDLFTPVQLSL